MTPEIRGIADTVLLPLQGALAWFEEVMVLLWSLLMLVVISLGFLMSRLERNRIAHRTLADRRVDHRAGR